VIKINEVFFSIQGESSFAGFPTVFVRTTGCNLRCTYCDSKYSYYEGSNKSQEELLNLIKSFGTKYVCITGGEPLLQSNIYSLMKTLCDNDFVISLETSGSKLCHQVDQRVKIILDVKTPDSGAKNSFKLENLNNLSPTTELKFVICTENDFTWAEEFCHKNQLFSSNPVFYSPSFGQIDPQWLAEKILSQKSKARLQLQLHKYIWPPDKRGV